MGPNRGFGGFGVGNNYPTEGTAALNANAWNGANQDPANVVDLPQYQELQQQIDQKTQDMKSMDPNSYEYKRAGLQIYDWKNKQRELAAGQTSAEVQANQAERLNAQQAQVVGQKAMEAANATTGTTPGLAPKAETPAQPAEAAQSAETAQAQPATVTPEAAVQHAAEAVQQTQEGTQEVAASLAAAEPQLEQARANVEAVQQQAQGEAAATQRMNFANLKNAVGAARANQATTAANVQQSAAENAGQKVNYEASAEQQEKLRKDLIETEMRRLEETYPREISQETRERMATLAVDEMMKKYGTGDVEKLQEFLKDPIAERREKQARMAEAEDLSARQGAIEQILQNREPQEAFDDLDRQIGTLAQELASMSKERPLTKENTRRTMEAISEMAGLRTKMNALLDYADQNGIEFSRAYDGLEDAAAIDYGTPDGRTQEELDRQAAERVAALTGNDEVIPQVEAAIQGGQNEIEEGWYPNKEVDEKILSDLAAMEAEGIWQQIGMQEDPKAYVVELVEREMPEAEVSAKNRRVHEYWEKYQRYEQLKRLAENVGRPNGYDGGNSAEARTSLSPEEIAAAKSEMSSGLSAAEQAKIAQENAEVLEGREGLVSRIMERLKKHPKVYSFVKKAVAGTVGTLGTFTAVFAHPANAMAAGGGGEIMSYDDYLKETERAAAEGRAGQAGGREAVGAKIKDLQAEAMEALEAAGLTPEELGNTEETRELNANGSRSDYAPDYANFEEKSGPYNYGVDKSEYYGNARGALNSLIEIGRNQPESQASYFAGLGQTEAGRQIWRECGINFEPSGDIYEDMRKIDDVISNAENGAEVQAKIDAKMAEIFGNEHTERAVKFYQEYRKEKTSYIYQTDMHGEGRFDSSDLELGYSVKQRSGQKQMLVGMYAEDGTYLGTIDLNMECGFQVNVEMSQEDQEKVAKEVQKIQRAVKENPELRWEEVPGMADELRTVTWNIDPIDPGTPDTPPDTPPEPDTPPDTPPEPDTPPDTDPDPEPDPEPEPEEPGGDLKPKNPEKGKEIWDNNDHSGEADQTKDVNDTAEKNKIEDDMPAENNSSVTGGQQINNGGDETKAEQGAADERREETAEKEREEAEREQAEILKRQQERAAEQAAKKKAAEEQAAREKAAAERAAREKAAAERAARAQAAAEQAAQEAREAAAENTENETE